MSRNPRPSTLRSRITWAAVGLGAAVLALTSIAIDRLMAYQLGGGLERIAAAQLDYIEAGLSLHPDGDNDGFAQELEQLQQQTAIEFRIAKLDRVLFASDRLSRASWSDGVAEAQIDGVPFLVRRRDIGPLTVTVAVSRAQLLDVTGRLRFVMLAGFASGLVVMLVAVRWLAGRATAPLDELRQSLTRLDLDSIDKRPPLAPGAPLEVLELESAFDQLLHRLDRAASRLRRLTADASHELRTPIAVLKARSQAALLDATTPAAAREVIAAGLVDVDRLEKLVNDLLLIARLDAGAVERRAVDVTDVVIETVEDIRPLAERCGVDLTLMPAPPLTLPGEHEQLRRLLTNLLDNAIRHTPRGGAVTVRLVETSLQQLELSVADSGRGIEADRLGSIFEPFVRTTHGPSSGGAGLGLAIASRIADAHGGTIGVTSALGQGSTFTVRFPRPMP